MPSDSEYSSRYATPEPVISSALPHTWHNDPAFGIIHSVGCKTCRDFMGHVVAASQTHDSSFQQAVQERDSQLTVRFLDGIREGRRLQRDHDHERLSRYRNERNEAFDLNAGYRARLLELREELQETKDRLLALQIAYDELSRADRRRSFSDVGDDSSEDFSILEMQSVLFGSSPSDGSPDLQSVECDEHAGTIPLHTLPPIATSDVDSQHAGEPQSSVPEVIFAPSTISDGWSYVREHSGSRPPSPDGTNGNHSEGEVLTESAEEDFTSSSSASSGSSVSSEPHSSSPADEDALQDLASLKALMAVAHLPGNTRELEKVRMLCSRAHRTLRSQRTDLQKYLLLSWRSPPLSSNVPLPSEPISRRVACEVFVDASKIGIGFISNGRWHAWKLLEGWKKDGRDTSWAEMVAVELGLRTLVAAGYRSADITIRSDNGGVVNSLHSKSARNPQECIILKEILSLCKAFDINLIPKWISTKQNPADGPSREVYPSRLLLFPTSPPLPVHLLSFVQPVLV